MPENLNIMPDPEILAKIEEIEPEKSTFQAESELLEAEARAEQSELDKQQLEALLLMSFGLVGSVAGDHWSLTPSEASQLAAALDPVLDKYLPGLSLGCEVGLLITLSVVFIPKVAIHKQKAQQQMEVTPDGNQSE